MYLGTYSCSARTVALVLRCRNGSSKISSFGITPGVKPGSVQATSTTPSRTCASSCSALPPSCMDGNTWTLMRPLDSFSTFCAHGVTQCFIGLATGGRNECTRSVTSCDRAGGAPNDTPATIRLASAATRNFFMMSSLGDWATAHAIFAASQGEGNEPRRVSLATCPGHMPQRRVRIPPSNQLQPLQAGVAFLADDDVVVHRDAAAASRYRRSTASSGRPHGWAWGRHSDGWAPGSARSLTIPAHA